MIDQETIDKLIAMRLRTSSGVFTMPDLGVHDADFSVHDARFGCSRCADLSVHDAPISAPCHAPPRSGSANGYYLCALEAAAAGSENLKNLGRQSADPFSDTFEVR